jgi:hypothetical protein
LIIDVAKSLLFAQRRCQADFGGLDIWYLHTTREEGTNNALIKERRKESEKIGEARGTFDFEFSLTTLQYETKQTTGRFLMFASHL